jgi:alpha-L-fucosidase
MKYRTAASIINELVDTVSKNGNLMLNISPMGDGSIPEPQQKILGEIGHWLAINGEAILRHSSLGDRFSETPLYAAQIAGANPHEAARKPPAGNDFRFTTKGKRFTRLPSRGQVSKRSLRRWQKAKRPARSRACVCWAPKRR